MTVQWSRDALLLFDSLCLTLGLFSNRPWTTISTRAPRPTGLSTTSWTAWALWPTISQTSPCPPSRANPAKGRHPTTCATFASTKDTTSKTALRWASESAMLLHVNQVQIRTDSRLNWNSCAECGPFWGFYQMQNMTYEVLSDTLFFHLVECRLSPFFSTVVMKV